MSFQAIYDLAIKADLPGLIAHLADGACIDVRAPGGLNTAVSQLAKEGNSIAVDFLLANGANPDQAVFGYALGGYFSKVDELIDKNGADKDLAAFGYAIAGNFTQANALINNKYVNVDTVIQGYALGGYFTQVDELLARGANVNLAVNGAALGGYSAQVSEMIDRKLASIDDAVFSYARGGHFIQVAELITRGASVNDAVEGYAFGGHFTHVDELINNAGADINSTIRGYARGGYSSKVNELILLNASVHAAATGYARGGHLTQKSLLRLVSQTANESLKNALIDSNVHSAGLDLCKKLGYKLLLSGGICHGFSLRWLEASLLNEVDVFDKRVKKIVLGGDQLIDEIEKVKKKRGLYLTPHDHELIDILAFYDSLALYHDPITLFSVFKVKSGQSNFEIASHFAASDKIMSRNGLAIHYSEAVIYTELEIKAYLDSLGQILEHLNDVPKNPIGVMLSNVDHSIAKQTELSIYSFIRQAEAQVSIL